ncbi:alpha/beta fold hydrolase [Sulfurihydrogenibium sp.]|uniref:alpha/beta fold hydrolase n=1 Tax=Sulfurihydrogenibium sp. TaxID=2053621 RepID=UPI00260C1B17|nr:alpha/beta fold hydrolase [Sulfurihydrogenibium sp.]
MKKVFIHGWGFSKNVWKDYFYLDDAQFIDLPFHGDSKTSEFTTLDSFAGYLSEKIDEPTTLIGWSIGATISVLTALKNPHVKKLILIGFSPKFNDEKLGSSPSSIKAFMINLKKDFEKTVKNFRITSIENDPSCRLPEKEGSTLLLNDFIEADLTDRLQEIKCETHILHGIKDKIVNKEAAFFTHSRIEKSQLYLFDSHHGPFLERDITEIVCQ